MLLALLVAERHPRSRALAALSALFIVGVLGEVDTLGVVRRPRSDPISTVFVALELALPVAMLAATRRRDGLGRYRQITAL
jgi:hypothetical protein